MKRHLLVLSPLIIFCLFVACGDDKDPVPPLNAVKEIKFCEVAYAFTRGIEKCRNGANEFLPFFLAQQQQQQGGGQNNDLALLTSLLGKKRSSAANNRPPLAPPPPGCPPIPPPPPAEDTNSCQQDLTLAVLMAKGSRTNNNSQNMWEGSYGDYFKKRLERAAIQFGASSGLDPYRQVLLGQQVQTALATTGTFSPADLQRATQALQAPGPQPQQAGYNGVGGMTLGQGTNNATLTSALNNNSGQLGNNPNGGGYQSAQVNQPTQSLGLSMRALTSEQVGNSELVKARGFGLSINTSGPHQ